MGANECKSQKPECGTIEAEDVNFDLPGCLESLTDMAHTGKTHPLRKASATSRALFGMSRALSAPVTATDMSDPKPRRPSLTRCKAVSLDTYTVVPTSTSSPSHNHTRMSSNSGLSLPLSTVEESETGISETNIECELLTQDMNTMDTLNIQKHRASPSIEIIPPESIDLEQHPYEENTSEFNQQILESELHSAVPQLSPIQHQYGGKTNTSLRLHVPGTSDKHSLLEKRKKLSKSNRIEEDSPDAVHGTKRHSNPSEKDWDKIQEWMVWCIHENLDDTSEEEISPCVSPMNRGYRILQQQYSDPLRSHNTRSALTKTHNQFANLNISSSPITARQQKPQQKQFSNSYSSDFRYRSNSYTSPKSNSQTCYTLNTNSPKSTNRSPVTKKSVNGEKSKSNRLTASAWPGIRPKHRSLDNPLFKHSGQSSFESSSGSSHMNSFDSTGTHNDRLL